MMHHPHANHGLVGLALASRGLAPTPPAERERMEGEGVERHAPSLRWLRVRFVAAVTVMCAFVALNQILPPQA